MDIDISIDLGNVWEMLSAVGTIGAVVVSLWLAKRESKIRADFHVEGIDEPMNISRKSFEDLIRIISFKFYNLGNYKMSITSIRAVFLKKPANFLSKNYFHKSLKKKSKFNEIILLNEPKLGQYSSLPLNIEAKSDDSFFFLFSEFIKSFPSKNNQYILFIAKDSMGNEYYDYKELESKTVKKFLKENKENN